MSAKRPVVAVMCRHGEVTQRLAVVLAPGRSLRVVVQRRHRRTLAIHVYRDATVEVRAPVACPLGTVLEFVRRRRAWIKRQLEWAATYPPTRALQYTQGERHRYLGECVMLVLRSGSPRQGQLAQLGGFRRDFEGLQKKLVWKSMADLWISAEILL